MIGWMVSQHPHPDPGYQRESRARDRDGLTLLSLEIIFSNICFCTLPMQIILDKNKPTFMCITHVFPDLILHFWR